MPRSAQLGAFLCAAEAIAIHAAVQPRARSQRMPLPCCRAAAAERDRLPVRPSAAMIDFAAHSLGSQTELGVLQHGDEVYEIAESFRPRQLLRPQHAEQHDQRSRAKEREQREQVARAPRRKHVHQHQRQRAAATAGIAGRRTSVASATMINTARSIRNAVCGEHRHEHQHDHPRGVHDRFEQTCAA